MKFRRKRCLACSSIGVLSPLEGETEILNRRGEVGDVANAEGREEMLVEKERRTRSRFSDGVGEVSFLDVERADRSQRMRTNAVSR